MIAESDLCVLHADAIAADPVVQRWRRLFAPLATLPESARPADRCYPGPAPHPPRAYLRALLLKIAAQLRSIPRLRAYLLEHPLLVLDFGFRPVRVADAPYGFDVARTVPGERWLRQQQRTFGPAALQAALAHTVHTVQAQVPAFATTVALDVTHLYAYVRENNPKETIAHRFAPARRPRGDRDCHLGVKAQSNQRGTGRQKTYFWGYASGLATTATPAGDVVLADLTHAANQQDITVFRPLYAAVCTTLGAPPPNLTADAAFDAWYVYDACVATGGIAAIAPNRRHPAPPRSAEGHPCCAKGFAMQPAGTERHVAGHRLRAYRCPLRGTSRGCDHPRFPQGGCTKRINIEAGGLVRATLDRTDPAYGAIYRQRTSVERVNSHLKAFGLERPIVRTVAAVTRLTTLTAIVVNLCALERLARRFPDGLPTLC